MFQMSQLLVIIKKYKNQSCYQKEDNNFQKGMGNSQDTLRNSWPNLGRENFKSSKKNGLAMLLNQKQSEKYIFYNPSQDNYFSNIYSHAEHQNIDDPFKNNHNFRKTSKSMADLKTYYIVDPHNLKNSSFSQKKQIQARFNFLKPKAQIAQKPPIRQLQNDFQKPNQSKENENEKLFYQKSKLSNREKQFNMCFANDSNSDSSKFSVKICSQKEKNKVKECVGKVIAIFPQKQRISKDKKFETSAQKQVIITGTGTLIGKNLVLTAAHVLYWKKFEQMAERVYFHPQGLDKSCILQIKATNFKVFQKYKHCQFKDYHDKRYDIGLIVLEDNQYCKQDTFMQIEWGYNLYENKKNPIYSDNFNLLGYPQNTYQQEYLWQINSQNLEPISQNQFLYYPPSTSCGISGGPFIVQKKQKKQIKLKMIGLHKGKGVNISFGLTFNDLQNTHQMLLQLLQDVNQQNNFPNYQPSYRKFLQMIKKEDKNLLQNIKINILQKQNEKLRNQLRESQKKIQQLQSRKFQQQRISEKKQRLKPVIQQNETISTLNQKIIKLQKQINTLKSQNIQLNQQLQHIIQQQKQTLQNPLHKYIESLVMCQKGNALKSEYFFKNIRQLQQDHYFRKFNVKLTLGSYILNHTNFQINMQDFLKNNWETVQIMNLNECKIQNWDWKLFNKKAYLFENLKVSFINHNKLTQITQINLQGFKSLCYINLQYNPLNQATKQYLKKLKDAFPNIKIIF